MTLCMAAKAYDRDNDNYVIVMTADRHAEVPWAGGNVAFKFSWGRWNCPAMIAGSTSKAEDFLATCRTTLEHDPDGLTQLNIFDKFNGASNIHKRKLCERYVQQKLGMDFERFLTRGAKELPPDFRARIFHELGEIEFGGEVAVVGFADDDAFIVEVDRYGEVEVHQNFAAIGSGSVIAKSTLYQREQSKSNSIERTIYNLYEAGRLAHASAPSVGAIVEFLVVLPPPNGEVEIKVSRTNLKCLTALEKVFQTVGPKPVKGIPTLDLSCFEPVEPELEGAQQMDVPTVTPPPESGAGQPSDSQTSEGQP